MDQESMFKLLVDLHRDGDRQGPGGDDETLRALALTRLDRSSKLQVADIGCGTGASATVLASALPNAKLTAVDIFPEFLAKVSEKADAAGHGERISTLNASMDSLPFEDHSLDMVWSEGAIYNMGFEAGIRAWSPFLKPGGILAVSEITWLKPNPPEEIGNFWTSEYPEIATAAQKAVILEGEGYDLVGYFVLPAHCWIDNYYQPVLERTAALLEQHKDLPEAAEVVGMHRKEMALYKQYGEWFSYGFYICRKR